MSRWLQGDLIEVGGPWWRRDCSFREGGDYELGPEGSGWIIRIPAGFVFQASVPWWAAPVLRLFGVLKKLRRPSGLHDYVRLHREFALWFGDLMFPDACRIEGVREPWLTLCWWAVRTNNNRT